MKKTIAILLTVLLLLSMSNALAYDQEITFQGIPWGSTPAEWVALLKETYGEKLTGFDNRSCTTYLEFKLKNKKLTSAENNKLMVAYGNAKISDKIGGYDVEGIYFSSIFADDKQNFDESFLYQVTVSLIVNDSKEAEKDLQNKLTTLYGKESQVIKNVGYFKLTLHCWLGTDDTFVLMGERPPFEGNELVLVWYGKMINPDEFRKQFASPTPTPEPHSEADPSDTNGL